jgi:uncharacterized protein (DUF427 family)
VSNERAETGQKRVRAYLGGELVVDTRTPTLVWEWPYYPTYHLPEDDVLATLTDGTEGRLDVTTKTTTRQDAARRTEHGIRFDWAALDEWFEEDEPVYVHPRDPYKRVDILGSSRHVHIEVDGTTLVDSHQPRILFETSLPPRYYVPLTDVRLDLLTPSDTISHCPYKGTATYWHAVRHEDLVWIYRTPLAESQKIAGLATVYTEVVDLWLDGELQERPRTHFR